MKYTRATFERSLFNLVFLNFLNIRKDFYKPQQFALKRYNQFEGACITSVKTFFQEHFQENEGFLEILKQLFIINFPEFSLPTYFLLTINY